MGEIRWPALAIQGVFLAANIAFLLAGRADGFIVASTTTIMLLFAIQSLSKNPRFLYLFPVDTNTGIATPSWDTWILKALLILSIFLFYVGATGSYILACVILIIALAFPIIWDKFIDEHNRRKIDSIKQKETQKRKD